MQRKMDCALPGALFLIAALLALGGCEPEAVVATPLPPGKSAYVGIWEQGQYGRGETYVYLQISEDGYFSYARIDTSGVGSSCMAIEKTPVGSISDTRITVPLFWDFTLDFAVNATPRQSAGALRMTIDGDALQRTDSRRGGFDYVWQCDDGDISRRRVS